MTTVSLLPNQQIKLSIPGHPHEFNMRVLDTQGETVVLRVPEGLKDVGDPDEVELGFGYRSFYLRGPARVKAHYERWWFVLPPIETDCKATQRRDFVRVSFSDTLVAIPTNPLGEPVGSPVRAEVSDLSAGGCLALMPKGLATGDHLLILLALPGMPVNPIISRIVRTGEPGEGGVWYGVRFESLDDRSQEELAHFVAGYIKEKLREGVDVTRKEAGVED
jgi:hypothetical protein